MRFTERLVGIDVIGWNPALPSQQVRSFLSTMKPYCHINEYRFIQCFADPAIQLRTFHLFWSLKEALLKAIGCGIADPARPLSQYDFSRCRKEGRYWLCNVEPSWVCFAWIEAEHTILAVAAGRKDAVDDSVSSLGGAWIDPDPIAVSRVSLESENRIRFDNGDCLFHIEHTTWKQLLSSAQPA